MPRRTVGQATALGLIAASVVVLTPAAFAASSQQRACYTATTFRAVSSAGACRGAEAYISWKRHGLTNTGEVTGGTRPKKVLSIAGDTGAHGPIVPARAIRGARGLVGLRGVAGDSGAQGPQGASGPQGTQGEQGLRGVAGETGPRGLEGPEGQQGIQGIGGLTGAQGLAGLTGPAGADGATGATGPQGVQGPQGLQGDPGVAGVGGPAGPAGAAGPQGAQGAQGLPGDPGVAGPAGPQGPAGPVTGFRKTLVASTPLLVTPTPLATVTPPAGAYLGGATTTITGAGVAATITCSISDGSTILGQTTVVASADPAVPTVTASVQLGVFVSNATPLAFACASDQPDAATASNTVFAGVSLDAIAETP